MHEEARELLTRDIAPVHYKKAEKTRKTVTADTGITGKNATRYRALKRAIKLGKVKPNIASIKKFKHGGRGMGTDTARKYLEALKQGV